VTTWVGNERRPLEPKRVQTSVECERETVDIERRTRPVAAAVPGKVGHEYRKPFCERPGKRGHVATGDTEPVYEDNGRADPAD
jgi:hypothetical protein